MNSIAIINAWNAIARVPLASSLFTGLLAVLMGAIIGAERERRYRMAGLRTNALVCVVASIFVHTAKEWQVDGGGHNQAYVITGAAWVAGALLYKDVGGVVKGLDSAITIWGAAAVGCAIGGGSIQDAIGGTLVLLLCNTGLRSAVIRFRTNGQSHPEVVAPKPHSPVSAPVPVPIPGIPSHVLMETLVLYQVFVKAMGGSGSSISVQQLLAKDGEGRSASPDTVPIEFANRVLTLFERAAAKREDQGDRSKSLSVTTITSTVGQ